MNDSKDLPYDLNTLPREGKKFYISSTQEEIKEMLAEIGKTSPDELYDHLNREVKFSAGKYKNIAPLSYEENLSALKTLSQKNNNYVSFIGDGLRSFSVPQMTEFTCGIRGLTTAYTPYQPERSQGTLWSLWLYSNLIANITGFEAINASLYDRSTALYEAAVTSRKISRSKAKKILLIESIHPNDLEVFTTLAKETEMDFDTLALDPSTGTTNIEKLNDALSSGKYYALAFSQTNCFGLVEPFDEITDAAQAHNIKTICDIDLLEINKEGLKKPSDFGKEKKGVDIIIGEGQHLALAPNFGGPGIGIFGVRYNKTNKLDIRSTPGRFVGKTVDADGKECLCMVLSTREQHIRREKATSNICSNQSFLATLVGASLLERGSEGLEMMLKTSRDNLSYFVSKIKDVDHISFPFATSIPFNQIPLEIGSTIDIETLIDKASDAGIHIGVNVSNRARINKNLLLISFNDIVTKKDIDQLINFLGDQLGKRPRGETIKLNINQSRKSEHYGSFNSIELSNLKSFYQQLGQLNVSPDENIYPLGSCTMKYNPFINDFNASLPGFTAAHPQAPIKDVQGCLEVLWQIQERFKEVTGLPGVTTQPVAGAQGELVGIKLFQAYHSDKGEVRDIILIPKSAHGTNPATATMAGIKTQMIDGIQSGIIPVDADANGQIDMEQMKGYIKQYGARILGVMVTNPNTSGIFESNFKEMSDLIHSVGGLVYMDGANMNAIAGIVDLNKLGVDAVHNNLHKTWTIPHGGGGPGDAIVAVSEKLIPYLPGKQIQKNVNGKYELITPEKTIGSFHRHFGNFAHKVRCLTYLNSLGSEGVIQMSSIAVLSSCYLFEKLKHEFPTLPFKTESVSRMHEFIITLTDQHFSTIAAAGIPKSQIIGKLGKLFLDFGIHAPTVSFPEPFGLMIEPTESYTKKELDGFIEVLKGIKHIITSNPEVLHTVPHFTPVKKVDEVKANKDLIISDDIFDLPQLNPDKISPKVLSKMTPPDLCEKIVSEHQKIVG